VRALVTGCAGFIGSHLAEALLLAGLEVVGLDSLSDNYSRQAKLRNLEPLREWKEFECFELDLARDDLEGCSDSDVVFHLAGEPGVRTSWGPRFELYERNNVLATQRLLEVLRSQPATRFVFASSSSVYGQAERLPTPESTTPRPVSPYGVTKLSAEHLCHLYQHTFGMDTVVLRYFSVYGPRQRPDMAFHRFCRAAIESQPITIFGDGHQTRDFTFVSDVVAATTAAARASTASGHTYNVGGGAETSLMKAVEIIGELAGRALQVRCCASESGDVRSTGADTTRAQADLAFRPATALTDGLAAEFRWMQEELRDA
jgi:nucleoside-diphosphate-sugar epimerase